VSAKGINKVGWVRFARRAWNVPCHKRSAQRSTDSKRLQGHSPKKAVFSSQYPCALLKSGGV
jgi:hypothetical protein